MDLFILFSTILIYASLIAVLATAAYSRKSRDGIAMRIDRSSRWGFPLFFLVSWVGSMFLPI
jgi:surface polysaccharide O-acyltransferase-like enzyme